MSTSSWRNHNIRPLDPVPTQLDAGGRLDHGIQCVLFDIYGTLFISASGDVGVAKAALQEPERLEKLLLKFKVTAPSQEILEQFFASIEKTHERLRKKGVDYPEVVIEDIWMQVLSIDDVAAAKAFAVAFEDVVNPVCPMPHLSEMLSMCRRMKVLTGIISNAQFYTHDLFRRFFHSGPEQLGFDPDLIFYSYAWGYAKPSQLMYKAAAERLYRRGVAPISVLYVGNDMLNDIYPAKMTGFSTALFAGDARSLRLREDHPACRNMSPDLVVTDLLQIVDHIQSP
jgi:putative hydrolase of the HAD superfamily